MMSVFYLAREDFDLDVFIQDQGYVLITTAETLA